MSEIPCQQMEELLTPYLLGDLDTEQAEAVRVHLEACGDCRALAQELEPTLDLLRGALAAPVETPVQLAPERMEKILQAAPRPGGALLAFNWGLVARAAAVLVVGFTLVIMFLPAMSRSRRSARLDHEAVEVEMELMEEDATDLEELEIEPAEMVLAKSEISKDRGLTLGDQALVAGKGRSIREDSPAGPVDDQRAGTRRFPASGGVALEHGAGDIPLPSPALAPASAPAYSPSASAVAQLKRASGEPTSLSSAERVALGRSRTRTGEDVSGELGFADSEASSLAVAGKVKSTGERRNREEAVVSAQVELPEVTDTVRPSYELAYANGKAGDSGKSSPARGYAYYNFSAEESKPLDADIVDDNLMASQRVTAKVSRPSSGKPDGTDYVRGYEIAAPDAGTPGEERLAWYWGDEDEADLEALDVSGVVESPTVMKGLFAGRTSAGRASALGAYGGGARSGEAAVLKSLEWLKSNQHADGSWNHEEPASTSLGLLAFLAHGETPASERYGAVVEKAMRNLVDKQDEQGRFSSDPDEHALATYALTEAYGVTRVPMLKPVVEKAAIEMAQTPLADSNRPGGDTDAWMAPALKSAYLAGVDGREMFVDTMKAKADSAKKSNDPIDAYALQLMGHGNDEATVDKLARLEEVTFNWQDQRPLDEWLRIHQAKFHRGGSTWTKWNAVVAPELLRAQQADGSWPARTNAPEKIKGPAATTALASLMFQTYYRFLPTLSTEAVEPWAETDEVEVTIEEAPEADPEPAEPEKEPEEDEPEAFLFKAYGVNPVVATRQNPFSTFSIDVDTASYTLARNYMLGGLLPPAEAVRTEEFVNFFDYGYRPPRDKTFAVHTEYAHTPFGRGDLLKIGVKGRRLGREEERPAVLTVVIDTSGSMDTPDRLGLVRKSLHLLLDRLAPTDRVGIIQYDSRARLVLEHRPASERGRIASAIDGVQTSGSTHLEEGIRLAYEMAARAFEGGAVNRVLLLSDGVANLGSGSAEEILKQVSDYREQGILLSVFGFGKGTYNDVMLETLANKGDGTYQFIDSVEEAGRVFVDDLSATLNVIARDVKIQVEFDPKRVKRYRQLGYENRMLAKEDFRDDTVDAGEVGSGQSVTALYEIELQGDRTRPIGVVRMRYRDELSGQVEETAHTLAATRHMVSFEEADPHFKLAASVAEFAEILRGSPYAAGSEFEEVAKALRPVALDLHLDQRVQELARLVHVAPGIPRATR